MIGTGRGTLDFQRYTEIEMPQPTFQAKPYVQVLRNVFDIPGRGMSTVLADSILTLDFSEDDFARIEILSDKANEGTLTDDETAELEAFVNIGDLLANWQSKARQAIHKTG